MTSCTGCSDSRFLVAKPINDRDESANALASRPMIRPVSGPRPVRPLEALRQSSEQIRKAAELLADLADDTADLELPSAAATLAGDLGQARRDATILQAQRGFAAGLRLSQAQEQPETR